MPDRVKVHSLETLREFRTQVCLFTIRAHTALDEIAGEARGIGPWLQEDRFPFWRSQVQNRLRRVADARAALNRSRLDVLKTSHLEEEQEVSAALASLRSAEEKVRTVRAWARKYESASQPLVGRMYALSHVIEQDMPKAVALLDRLLAELEAYAASTSPAPAGSERGAESATTGAAAGGGRESDVTASANVCSGDAVRTGVPPRQP